MVVLTFYDPFVNLLVSVFGDELDDPAIERLRGRLPGNEALARQLRAGFDDVLATPSFDRVTLVTRYANRWAETDAEARAWLEQVRARLFA